MLRVNDIKWLKNEDPDYIIDSVTKVISRHFIIKIANELIKEKTPFTLIILESCTITF